MLADEITPAEVDEAVAELSSIFGWSYGDTYENIRQRAGGERDPGSLALAAAQLHADALGEDALALAAGYSQDEYYVPAEIGRYLALAASGRRV